VTTFRDRAHGQVVFDRDRRTGLRAIIALHDVTRRPGPGLGGTRFVPYRHETDAIADVLRPSGGVTRKAAVVGMPVGGAKGLTEPRAREQEGDSTRRRASRSW
jgi:valine dehydrogenase (NAD+)